MNWILTTVFLVLSFLEFEFLGLALNTLLTYKTGIIRNWLMGYFAFFAATIPLGIISQITLWSWTFYWIAQTLILLALNLLVFLYLRKKGMLAGMASSMKGFFANGGWKSALAHNWFGILFIAVALFFLITSQLGVMDSNYDDYYYIGKMVHLQGADQMFMKNYYSGTPLDTPEFMLARMINTFELTYAYLSSLSGIYTVFFARVTMSCMQYMLLYFLVKEIASCFVSRKNAQYVMAGFVIFLIPDPYWQQMREALGTGFYSYDLWQFQNTPYYGSSVVRMSGLFTLVYFSLPLLKKIEWPKIVWVGVVSLVLMSYSTCLLPVFGLFAIGILAVKLLLVCGNCLQKKAWLKAAAALLGAAAIILFALLANRVLVLPASDLYETYRNSVESFQATNFVKDAMLRYGWVIIAVSLLLSRSRVQAGLSLLALFLWWSAAGFRLYNLIGLLSAGFDFVAFRFEGTVQMMLFFLMAVCLIKLVDWLKCSFWVAGGCSAAALAAALLIFFANMGQIIEHNYLGSGVSDYGWDFSRIFNFNSDMSADTARMIGDYINTLPYGTYRILSDNPVPNDSEYFLPNQFLMTSNRTQIVSLPYPYNWDLDTGGTVLEYVSTGEPDGQSALEWMDREGVDYAVVTSEKAKDELTAAGREVVLETRPKPEVPLYLIKIK